MNLINLGNESDFEKVISSNKVVLVDFYAEWCGPCKMMAPVLSDYASKNSDVTVLKVNTDSFQQLAQKFDIRSIPTLMIFKDGSKIDQKLGFIPTVTLEAWVNNYR